jgi:hypothetical protein
MRTSEAIIADLRNVLYWSQPNIKFDELSALINELEAIVTPTEETIIEEPVVKPVVEEVVEEIVEETVVEETKKTTKKK